MIEFVLRERAYCGRIIREVDERYWMAPSLPPASTSRSPSRAGPSSTWAFTNPGDHALLWAGRSAG